MTSGRQMFWPYALRCAAALCFLVLILACVGAGYQAVASFLDRRNNPPPGKLIDIGGYRMHIYCIGNGEPTVILDSGLSDSWLSWHSVQPEVSQFTQVCSYDRAGLGWSDSSPRTRTSKVFAEELHTLLQHAEISPPYVLVGHSMGGYDVRMFASLYRQEVVGMVLVDATHPDVFENLPKIKQLTTDWCRSLKWKEYETFFGIARLRHSCGNSHEDSPAMRRTIECREDSVQETRAECLSVTGESAAEVRATGELGNLPLVVLSEDPEKNNKEFVAAFERGQAQLAGLSNRSEHVTAKNSGHQIQLERPDLVIQAVRNVIERLRSPQ
jgi:pimeloyl-ACP methyl ester carboxylesterase